MNKQQMELEVLLNRISKDDEAAFSALYRTYQPGFYRFFLRYVHTEAMAEDLCQELFLKLWNHRGQLHAIRELRPYIYVLARNLALNALKRTSVSQQALQELLTHYPRHEEVTEFSVVDREYRVLLEEVLARLPTRSREIFMMCREQGKTYDEAAKILGISRNAIKNHMVSTLKVLKSFAEKQLGITLSIVSAVLSAILSGR